MDPDLATQMVLMSEDSLDATYLASSLLDHGLLTQAEYDERRAAIIAAA